MKQVFLKFLLVFFVVSQLIVMPMQTAFANELDNISDAPTEEVKATETIPVDVTSEQQEASQIINPSAEVPVTPPPTAEIETPKQETVKQEEQKEEEQPVLLPIEDMNIKDELQNGDDSEKQSEARTPTQHSLTNVQVAIVDASTMQPITTITKGSSFKMDMKFAIPGQVFPGDTFVVDLPSNLDGFRTPVNMKRPNGNTLASCDISETKATCTFTDEATSEGMKNVKGGLAFQAKFSDYASEGTNQLTFNVGGKVIELPIKVIENTGGYTTLDTMLPLGKAGYDNGDNTLQWAITVSGKQLGAGTAKFKDKLGAGHKFKPGTKVTLQKNQDPNASGGDAEEIKNLVITDNTISFEFEMKEDYAYWINYNTEITDTSVPAWLNSAQITSSNSTKQKDAFVKNSGYIDGDIDTRDVQLALNKVDAETKEPLSGANFELTNIATGQKYYLNDSDTPTKYVSPIMPGGRYLLKELRAPQGYEIDKTVRTIVLSYYSPDRILVNNQWITKINYEFTNKKIEEPKGTIEIVKKQQAEEVTNQLKDGTAMTLQTVAEKTLAGAEFTVKNAAGEVVATLTTGEDGTAKADNLPVGTYTVTETKAPTGYVLDATPFTVEVTADKVVTKTVYNKLAKPQFTCSNFTVTVKGNGTNKDVVRPNITVTAEKGDKKIEFGVTNNNGQVTIDRSKLEAGFYTFTAKDNDGKVVSTQMITITDEDCAAELNVAPVKCERFEITITKDKQPVPNKEYFIIVKDNVRLDLKTNENGKMYIPNTEEGTYTLIDAEDEEQFKEITVSFDGNCGTTLELPLVPVIKGCERFEVTVKENGKVVANTEYQLQQNGKVITTVTTDENGKFSVDRDTVTLGDYELVKDGKKVADIKVEYNKCEFEVDTTVENTCPKFEITVNENSKAVVNATYTATNGESVLTITTDDNGKFVIDRTKVVTGKYVVTQGEKVVGEFTVTEADCEAVVDVTPKYSCEKYEVIVVTEGDNTVRPGLDVTLQGEKELKGTTDKDGKVSFDRENVPAGDYKVIVDGKEIKTITIVDEDCKVTIELPKVEEPTTPVDPEKPTTPEKPVTPVDPEKPTTPEKPVTPVEPEKPTTPEKPVTPVDPEKPEAPKCEKFTVKVTGDNKAKAKVELVNGKTVIAGETNENGEFVVDRDVVISGKYEVIVNGEKQEVITVTEEDCEATITIKVTEQPQPEAPKCENFTVKVTGKGNADAKIKLVQGKTVIEGKTNKDGEFVVDRDVVISGKYEVTVNGKKQEAITVTEEDCEATVTLKKRPSGGGGGDRPDPKPEKPSVEVPNENPKPGKPEPKPEEPTAPETKPEEPTTPTEPETKPEEPTTPENPSVEIPNENPNTEKPQPEQPTVEVPNENPNTENEQAKPELPTVQQPNTDNKVEQPTISVPAKELPKAGNDTAVEKLPQTDGESTLGLMLTGFALIAASIFLFTRRKQMQ